MVSWARKIDNRPSDPQELSWNFKQASILLAARIVNVCAAGPCVGGDFYADRERVVVHRKLQRRSLMKTTSRAKETKVVRHVLVA